jgi:hypothetical protein
MVANENEFVPDGLDFSQPKKDKINTNAITQINI